VYRVRLKWDLAKGASLGAKRKGKKLMGRLPAAVKIKRGKGASGKKKKSRGEQWGGGGGKLSNCNEMWKYTAPLVAHTKGTTWMLTMRRR